MPCVPLSSALHCFVGFLPLLDLSAAPHHESPSSSCFVGLCAQIMMSLKTTASKYAKLSALPHAKPLSKAMIKKGRPGGDRSHHLHLWQQPPLQGARNGRDGRGHVGVRPNERTPRRRRRRGIQDDAELPACRA